MKQKLFLNMAIASAVLASDDVALFHLDSDSKIYLVSDGFCNLIGVSRSDIVGQSLSSFIPQNVKHIHNKPIDHVAEEMDIGEFDGRACMPFIKGNGNVIRLDLDIKVMRWPGQDRPHYCAFAKRARKAK